MWHFSARAVNYYHEMNWSYEAEEIRFSRADFRSVVKVDTHIHAVSARARGVGGSGVHYPWVCASPLSYI